MKLGDFYVKFDRMDITYKASIYSQNGSLISEATATCNVHDVFTKDKGRKAALKKALQDSFLIKDERKAIWEDYRLMTKTPRWNVSKVKNLENFIVDKKKKSRKFLGINISI